MKVVLLHLSLYLPSALYQTLVVAHCAPSHRFHGASHLVGEAYCSRGLKLWNKLCLPGASFSSQIQKDVGSLQKDIFIIAFLFVDSDGLRLFPGVFIKKR